MANGYVAELFRSFQGEGPLVGVYQLFLRMAGCSLGCTYCDTAWARERVADCSIRGTGKEERLANPVDVDELLAAIEGAVEAPPRVHSLSVTGGEPLEQSEFLSELLRRFRTRAVPVYLDTNGLDREAAEEIAPLVDIVALDIKLPSLCGRADAFDLYGRVLPIFGSRDLFCKIVIAEGFEMDELAEAARIVGAFERGTPVVIQPATPRAGAARIDADTLLRCYLTAVEHLDDVRVIPQCHTILGVE